MEVRLGYKQTDVGVIPQHWDLQDFGQLYAEPSRNGIYKTQEYQGRGTRIVKMGEMFGLQLISDQEMGRVLPHENSLLIVCRMVIFCLAVAPSFQKELGNVHWLSLRMNLLRSSLQLSESGSIETKQFHGFIITSSRRRLAPRSHPRSHLTS